METAIYYFLYNNSDFKLVSSKTNKSVYEGIEILLSNDLEKIFKNESYKYLNKIKLSYLINELNNKNLNKIIDNMQIITEGKEVLKKYDKNCHGGLYRLLKSFL